MSKKPNKVKAPEPIDIHIGSRLKAARSVKDMSQEQVAEIAGVTYQQMQKYESGKNRCSPARLVRLAGIYGRHVEWFFVGAPGYNSKPAAAGDDKLIAFLSLPYALDVAAAYVAIGHNADRGVVLAVTEALALGGRHVQSS